MHQMQWVLRMNFPSEYHHKLWLKNLVGYAEKQRKLSNQEEPRRSKLKTTFKIFYNTRIQLGNCHFGLFSKNGEYDYEIDVTDWNGCDSDICSCLCYTNISKH